MASLSNTLSNITFIFILSAHVLNMCLNICFCLFLYLNLLSDVPKMGVR